MAQQKTHANTSCWYNEEGHGKVLHSDDSECVNDGPNGLIVILLIRRRICPLSPHEDNEEDDADGDHDRQDDKENNCKPDDGGTHFRLPSESRAAPAGGRGATQEL